MLAKLFATISGRRIEQVPAELQPAQLPPETMRF